MNEIAEHFKKIINKSTAISMVYTLLDHKMNEHFMASF